MITFWQPRRLIHRLRHAFCAGALACAVSAAPFSPGQTEVRAEVREIPGASDPAFVEALGVWLQDDEATALPALAQLAQSGNQAARLLLGQIDKTAALQGPFLADLNRNARLALLRAPGGISGQSWLTHCETAEAALWQRLWSVDAGTEIAAEFRDLLETVAARMAFIVLSAREHPALSRIPVAQMDPELLYLLWPSADTARRARILSRVPAHHPQRAMMGAPLAPSDLTNWLASDPLGAPLAAVCTRACGTEQAQYHTCLEAAYHALGSHNALLSLGTPAEALIAQNDFVTTPRGVATTLRRLLLASSMRTRRHALGNVRSASACLAQSLMDENARYHPLMLPAAPQN